jgi:hypothetical protein
LDTGRTLLSGLFQPTPLGVLKNPGDHIRDQERMGLPTRRDGGLRLRRSFPAASGMTYENLSPDTLGIKFDIASADKPDAFSTYITAKAYRAGKKELPVTNRC